MFLVGLSAPENAVRVDSEHVQLGVIVGLVARHGPPLQWLKVGGLLAALDPGQDDGQRLVVGLRLLHSTQVAPLVHVPDGHGDEPGLLALGLLGRRVVRPHLVRPAFLRRDVGRPTEPVGVAMPLARAVQHLEVVAGEGVQPPPADSVRGLHGANVDQRLVVGADEEWPMLEVVTIVFDEVEDGHQLALGGVVIGL